MARTASIGALVCCLLSHLETPQAAAAGQSQDSGSEAGSAATPTKSRKPQRHKVLENSYACPEPWPLSKERWSEPYDRHVDRALGFSPTANELLVIRISPAFSSERTLSLTRRPDGSYWLRSRRLVRQVWGEMMDQMKAQQGDVIQLDDGHQARALARVEIPVTEKQRRLDRRTAELMLRMWTAIVARAQVVHEVGIVHAILDGTLFRIWVGNTRASTHSPQSGSVLGLAVQAAERLEDFVAENRAENEDLIDEVRFEMNNALERTRRKEPCLQPVIQFSN
jgi:hypothetical protein